jgi:hypothetical protein
MDDALLVSQLEEVARKLRVTVRYEPLENEEVSSTGGLCRVQNRHLILIDNRTSAREQASVLAKALRHFDVSRIYLRPGVRAFLDQAERQPTGTEYSHD